MDFKKLTLALCALGITSVATAGGFMPAPACTNHPVTVPCEHVGWNLGLTAYWLRPANDEFTYTSFGTFSVYPPHAYKFAFGVDGGYDWGPGNGLAFGWVHYDKDQSSRFVDNEGASPFYYYTGFDYQFDSVAVDLTQTTDIGPSVAVVSGFGAEYVKLEQSTLTAGDDAVVSNPSTFAGRVEDTSKFRGIGPQVVTNVQINLGSGFGVAARNSVALLVGNEKAREIAGANVAMNGGFGVRSGDGFLGKRHVVAAAYAGKLGLNYTHPMSQGSLMLEGGYGVNKLFNVIQSTGSTVAHAGETHSFGLDGWYATLKYTA